MLRNRLRELREEADITQKEIAAYLNISHSTYNRYECSSREPDLDTLIRLADYFDISLDELVGRKAPNSIDLLSFLRNGNYRICQRSPTERERKLFCRLISALYTEETAPAEPISSKNFRASENIATKKKP